MFFTLSNVLSTKHSTFDEYRDLVQSMVDQSEVKLSSKNLTISGKEAFVIMNFLDLGLPVRDLLPVIDDDHKNNEFHLDKVKEP